MGTSSVLKPCRHQMCCIWQGTGAAADLMPPHLSLATHLLAEQTAVLQPAPGPLWCQYWPVAPHRRLPCPPAQCGHGAQTSCWAGSGHHSPGEPWNHPTGAAWQALNRPVGSPDPHSDAPARASIGSQGFQACPMDTLTMVQTMTSMAETYLKSIMRATATARICAATGSGRAEPVWC